MAVCGSCGQESIRILSTFLDNHFKDACPNCVPEKFKDAFTNPSDKRLAMGWEAEPHRYKKVEGGYQASDSVLKDMEDAVLRQNDDDKVAYEAALERRRAYAKEHRTAESPAQVEANTEAARRLVAVAEARAKLEAMGIGVLDE